MSWQDTLMKEEERDLSGMDIDKRFAYICEKEMRTMMPISRKNELQLKKSKEFGELMGRTAKEWLDNERKKYEENPKEYT